MFFVRWGIRSWPIRRQGGHFVCHLHMLRQFRANVIWIVTFWLHCHISIFIAIKKLKTFYRWSQVRFAGFELRRFRNVRHHCLVSEHSTLKKIFADDEDSTWSHVESRRPCDIEWHFGPGRRIIFVVRETSNTPKVKLNVNGASSTNLHPVTRVVTSRKVYLEKKTYFSKRVIAEKRPAICGLLT